MRAMRTFLVAAVLAMLILLPSAGAQTRILFDAGHAQMAGNADWVLDEDTCDAPQRYPTPDQSTVTASTAESYWSGAFSAFGIDLVKHGYTVETLPVGAALTFGDSNNPQDLSNYDILVMPEPNVRFSDSEKQAILDFVNAGGGLFMIADHSGSDRNNDGWDSPEIFNDLGSGTEFGIHFNAGGEADNYFSDNPDDNYSTDPNDPIVHGPYGDASAGGGLGLFGSTSMTLSPSNNGTVTGHIWKTDGTPGSTTKVTFATAEYGSGRVAAVGDSSPAEDPTNDCGHTTHDGWTSTTYDNALIHLNAIAWLAGGGGSDTTPPVITAGPSVSPGDCAATVTWTTDEPATSRVDYGPTVSYGNTATVSGYTRDHSVSLPALDPSTTYHYAVSSTDAAGNGPTTSADATFATAAAAPPVITDGPAATAGSSWIRVEWTTDEPSDSRVEWGPDVGYGSSTSDSTLVTAHTITITGLAPSTTYHLRAGSADGCGNGPQWSADQQVTTLAPGVDISGWQLVQDNGGSELTFTFPAGTTLSPGDVVIVGRNMDQAAFESEWGVTLGPEVHYFDGGNAIPYVNAGDDTWALRDGGGTVVDGPTPVLSDQGNTNERTSPADAADLASSWSTAAWSSATPGTGPAPAGTDSVVLSEIADDTNDYNGEFVELYYDGPPSGSCTAPDLQGPVTAADSDACTADGVTVTWTDPTDWGDGGSGSRTVEVYRSADGGQSWTSCGSDPDGLSPFLDTGGDANTDYAYRVTATNGCGSSTSVESAGTGRDTVNGSLFGGIVSATDIDACTASGVRIGWNAVSNWNDSGYDPGDRQYRIERSTDGGATWTVAGTGPDNGLAAYTWDDTAAPAGTSLTYRVTATNGSGCLSGASAVRTVTDAASSAPVFAGIASAVDVDGCGDSGVALTWSVPGDWGDGGSTAGTRRFDILRDGVLVGAADATATGFTDTGAPRNIQASWVVRAVNACGDAADGGASVQATNTDDATPPTFAGASGVVASGQGCGATVTWDAAVPACGTGVVYNVYRSTTSGFVPDASNRVATGFSGTSFTDSGLTAGVTYHWIVRAEDRTTGHAGPNGGVEDGNTVEVSLTPGTGASPLDISGWTVVESDTNGNGTETFTFPSGTVLQPGDLVVIGRAATQAAFESAHGVTLGANVHYFLGGGAFPYVNGDPDVWTLEDGSGNGVDGPTAQIYDKKKSIHRSSATDPAGDTASWNVLDQADADPGTPPPATDAGVIVISEISDAADYTTEFVELFYDAAAGGSCTAVPEVSPPGSARPAVLVREDGSATGYVLYFEPVAGADGYNVMEEAAGDPTTRSCLAHGVPVTAVSGGRWDGWLRAEIAPSGQGSRLFLVTAWQGSVEGSAGTDSQGAERDPAANTCDP